MYLATSMLTTCITLKQINVAFHQMCCGWHDFIACVMAQSGAFIDSRRTVYIRDFNYKKIMDEIEINVCLQITQAAKIEREKQPGNTRTRKDFSYSDKNGLITISVLVFLIQECNGKQLKL